MLYDTLHWRTCFVCVTVSQEFIPHMAKQYGFQYELVQYKWPRWLHQQTEKQRIIWGYKILFLDVLFPLAVDKILFVDADQVRSRYSPCLCTNILHTVLMWARDVKVTRWKSTSLGWRPHRTIIAWIHPKLALSLFEFLWAKDLSRK